MAQPLIREALPIQAALPEKIIDLILDKLATDDVYRALFAREPEAAIRQLGYQPSAEQVMCLKPTKLADKATIAAVRDEMRERLILANLGQVPNRLNVGPK